MRPLAEAWSVCARGECRWQKPCQRCKQWPEVYTKEFDSYPEGTQKGFNQENACVLRLHCRKHSSCRVSIDGCWVGVRPGLGTSRVNVVRIWVPGAGSWDWDSGGRLDQGE